MPLCDSSKHKIRRVNSWQSQHESVGVDHIPFLVKRKKVILHSNKLFHFIEEQNSIQDKTACATSKKEITKSTNAGDTALQ